MTRGRPREFDTDAALDQALGVFVRMGFEQASVQALAEAMGICKPSLYAAYGNKETLFIAALRRYASAGAAHRAAILDSEPDARRAVMRLLDDSVAMYTSGGRTPGCMIVAEAASFQESGSSAVRDALTAAMHEGHDLLQRRLARGQDDGDLADDVDVAALAAFLNTLLSGLSVQARNGASADALRAVVCTAMRAWPAQPAMRRAPPVQSSVSRGRTAARN